MKRKWIIIAAVLIALVTSISLLSRESFYAKQTYAELIWHTIAYGVGNNLALVSSIVKDRPSFSMEVPMYRQEHRLSCEVSALRMALGRYLIDVSEKELLGGLAFSTHGPLQDGIWGDPERGFVGDPNGSLSRHTGYGVYEVPIMNLSQQYRPTVVLENKELHAIANLVANGKPVIVWMDIDMHIPRLYWQTASGKGIEAHRGEHARVVVGFVGEVHDPERLVLHDPIYGRITLSAGQFLEEWDALGRRAVVVN